MSETRDTADSTDIRQLRRTVHRLADAVDALVENERLADGELPEQAAAAADEAAKAREIAGEPLRESEKISPPWEREGYESKEAWLADQDELEV